MSHGVFCPPPPTNTIRVKQIHTYASIPSELQCRNDAHLNSLVEKLLSLLGFAKSRVSTMSDIEDSEINLSGN